MLQVVPYSRSPSAPVKMNVKNDGGRHTEENDIPCGKQKFEASCRAHTA